MIIVTKGSAKSGNYGHSGRPGKVGGSTLSKGVAEQVAAYNGLRDGGWINWSDKQILLVAKKAAYTQQLYGEPSASDAAKAHTHAKHIWYGDNPYSGGWHPLAKAFQAEILGNQIKSNDVLYRGVNGTYAKEIAKLQPDSTFVIDTFASTSVSEFVANSFVKSDGIMMEIVNSKGKPGLYVGGNAAEIILPAYSKFKVLSNNGKVIKLQYVKVDDPYE